MNFPIIKLRKIWYTISGLALIASVVMLFVWGLKFSIDFTGGSLIELTLKTIVQVFRKFRIVWQI